MLEVRYSLPSGKTHPLEISRLLEISGDCLSVTVPAQAETPEIVVTVNPRGIVIETNNEAILHYEFSDMFADTFKRITDVEDADDDSFTDEMIHAASNSVGYEVNENRIEEALDNNLDFHINPVPTQERLRIMLTRGHSQGDIDDLKIAMAVVPLIDAESVKRNPTDYPAEAVQTALFMTDREPDLETIAAWTSEQRVAAAQWAWLEHLSASDNMFRRVPMPEHVKILPVQQD
jgi:hypothetical protein